MIRQRLRSRLGQAMVEMTIVAPVLVLLMLGAADLGRAFYLDIEVTGASRAGVRTAIVSQGTDIGAAVRSEPDSAIKNDLANWGATGPGGNNDCNPLAAGHVCGDLAGCPPSAFSRDQVACFAVRSCTLDNGVCDFGDWGTRPSSASDAGLQVRVVYKMTPVTPAMAAFVSGTGGLFYLTSETTGLVLY